MQKTTNFNLNQWESTDPIRREDFNADNAAIDAALLAAANSGKAVYGSFTTTNSVARTIELGFKPKLVVFIGPFNGDTLAFGMAVDGMAIRVSQDSNYAEMGDCTYAIELTETGVYLKSGHAFNWGTGYTTRYLAIP